MSPRPITILPGEKFGQGTVINPDAGRRNGRMVGLICDPQLGGCGTTYTARVGDLRAGNTRSCGCLATVPTPVTTHGLSRHPLYMVWITMIGRCERPAASDYDHYGGRGITVWGPWHDVARFITDIESGIGPRPEGRTPGGMPLWTLNRIDNNGNYEPGNVEWANWVTQNTNRRQQRKRRGGHRTPEHYRQMIQMQAAGATYAQIGDAFGITAGSARKAIARASR